MHKWTLQHSNRQP